MKVCLDGCSINDLDTPSNQTLLVFTKIFAP